MNEDLVRGINLTDVLTPAEMKFIAEIARGFDASGYLAQHTDVAKSQMNPLEHYLRHGWKEGRKPNASFNLNAVTAGEYSAIPYVNEVIKGSIALATVTSEAPENEVDQHVYKIVSENFDIDFYRQQIDDAGVKDYVIHYIQYGVIAGLDPAPSFDTAYYLDKNHDIGVAGINPFYHYLVQGKKEGRLSQSSKKLMNETASRMEVENVGGAQHEDTIYRPLLNSGLFDPLWYRESNADISGDDVELARHYVLYGEAEGRKPNAVFEAKAYQLINSLPVGLGCLLHHYYQVGESRGLKPAYYFDPNWYAKEYKLPESISPLVHYIKNKHTNAYSPCEWFSPSLYLENNEDVAASGVNAFEHWYSWGMKEGRIGSAIFSAEHVWRTYLGGDSSKNPLDWFVYVGKDLGWSPAPNPNECTVHSEVRKFTSEGPYYEEFSPAKIPQSAKPVKAIAYYLTQFHAIPENDKWWGTGFTEWRNIPRGLPRFEGHYQPRIPRDLGYYELSDTKIMKRQVELARASGLYGFCFYYYNFAGHRLLERPLDDYINDPEIDFPFCLLWANENWTRRWDGYDNDVLMRQDYSEEHLPPLVDDLAKYLTKPNYIKVDGRPLLSFYRADVIPNTSTVMKKIRNLFIERHGIDPLLVIAQAFGTIDPRPHGFDAALEFPPHKIGVIQSNAQTSVKMFDSNFTGRVIRYDEAVDFALADQPTEYPLFKTAFPNWDNDARKQGSGIAFIESTPAKFERWLDGNIKYAQQNPVLGESIVFINAWNEWCEGAYLEPDVHHGHAYLNSLSRSLARAAGVGVQKKIILVGHDAFKAGAQQLLLAIGTHLTNALQVEVQFVLMSGGELLPDYQSVAKTYVVESSANKWVKLSEHVYELKQAGFGVAITNSIVSGAAVGVLKAQHMRVISLVHELPAIVREYSIQDSWEAIRANSDVVVFPNTYVKNELTKVFGDPVIGEVTRAQGIYKKIAEPAASSNPMNLRELIGVDKEAKIVLNMGYADYRKGLDLFVGVAEKFNRRDENIHFVWVGTLQDQLGNWVRRDVEVKGIKNVHFLPFDLDVAPYLFQANSFLLTSREDPFPSVVLEAIAAGLPVVCFDWGGGYKDLIAENPTFGLLASYLDLDDLEVKIRESLKQKKFTSREAAKKRALRINELYDFSSYCRDLFAMAFPGWRKLSVVIPNYNYGKYLSERVQSVLLQNYTPYEVLLLDDASSDDSIDVAARIIESNAFPIRLIQNSQNSGCVFKQWKKGLDSVSGEFVWIAEADDSANPQMLSRLMEVLVGDDDIHFAFCDSASIDSDGRSCYESYKGYYSSGGDHGLDVDGIFEAKEFATRFLGERNMVLNASSVVWRKSSLLRAFDVLGDKVFSMRCAGDWLVYIAACSLQGKIGYVADPLNIHRRHASSVTHAQRREEQLNEIQWCHHFANSLLSESGLVKRQEEYLMELRAQFLVASE